MQFRRSGFACAVRAEQAEALSLLNLEGDSVDRAQRRSAGNAILLAETAHDQWRLPGTVVGTVLAIHDCTLYNRATRGSQNENSDWRLLFAGLYCRPIPVCAGRAGLQGRTVLAQAPVAEQMDHAGSPDDGYGQGRPHLGSQSSA